MEIKQSYFLSFYNSLVDSDSEKCTNIVQTLLADGVELKVIYVELFQKSLYKIGKLWDHNQLSIPEEHLATQIIEALIGRFAPPPPINPKRKVIVSCIEKEFHEIGPKMVSNLFELANWKSFFLGASVPTKEIVKFVKRIDPDVIALSFGNYLNLARFLEVVEHLTRFFPYKKIIVGGQALNENPNNLLNKYPNTVYIKSVYELDDLIKSNLI